VRYKQCFHTLEEQHYLLYNYVGLSNVCLLAIAMSLSEISNPGRKIQIKAGQIEAMADLNDTKTAQAIWEALPLKGHVNLWGDEKYFSIPLGLELEGGRELVSVGDLGYWPRGNAFCIFFGATPISQGEEIRPASPVTVFGRVTSDTTVFKQVASGTEITIGRVDNG